MTSFPCNVGACITSWEIPQISPCPLHIGFGFEAAAEKRLMVMGCYTVLQLCLHFAWWGSKKLMRVLSIWSTLGKRNQKTGEWNAEAVSVWQTISWRGNHCLLFVFLVVFFKALGKSKLRAQCIFVMWLWHSAGLSSALESKPNTNAPIHVRWK